MRDWLSRLTWQTVVVVGLALAAVVAVVALLPGSARTDVIMALLTFLAASVGVAGALPAAVRPRDGGE